MLDCLARGGIAQSVERRNHNPCVGGSNPSLATIFQEIGMDIDANGAHFGAGKILLLSCCAPCSVAVIKTMAEEGYDFSVFFYNPNITPFAEYQKRCLENKRICEICNVPFIESSYDHSVWEKAVRGLENEPERGKRCSICFYIRLKEAMLYAKKNGYTSVASVLGVSRYKNLDQVNAAALTASKETGVPYIHIEGRKNGMQDLRQKLIKDWHLYNQNYCGCKPR